MDEGFMKLQGHPLGAIEDSAADGFAGDVFADWVVVDDDVAGDVVFVDDVALCCWIFLRMGKQSLVIYTFINTHVIITEIMYSESCEKQ